MKKVMVLVLLSIFCVFAVSLVNAGDERFKVPRVAYLSPDNDSTVDLTGKDVLTFKWKAQPVPAGGVQNYKLVVYKGFSYDIAVKEEVDRDKYSVDVPATNFEDGAKYSWHVQQRDASNMIWSLFDSWSFKVIKKK